MSEPLNEPWKAVDDSCLVDANGSPILFGHDIQCPEADERELMRRIAACVNRCNGIPTETLEDLDDDLDHDFYEAWRRLRDWKKRGLIRDHKPPAIPDPEQEDWE